MKDTSTKDTSTIPLKTPLFEQHKQLNGKMVDFGGWSLPVNYGSQIDEHNAVRNNCGMFDVSHMTVSDITGVHTIQLLKKILANDISKAQSQTGKAVYSCMLNHNGGVIDDLIVYHINDQHCRLVTNAATNLKDMAWLNEQASFFNVQVTEKPELALIAVQGPKAISTCKELLAADMVDVLNSLSRFQGGFIGDEFIGRTGYTGEDGIELIVNPELARTLWSSLAEAGVQACGLGARDTLRLEAGMALYGNDLDEQHTPYESGLAWTVSLNDDRDFIGSSALDKAQSEQKHMIGLVLQDRGVLRGHQQIYLKEQLIGEVTSGTFSPSLQQSIALARINQKLKLGDMVEIAVRNKRLKATVAKYPFIKNGKATNA